jgi:hypothetical protein
MVIRKDGQKGILEVMETYKNGSFYRYVVEDSELQGLKDGAIKWDETTGHSRPLIFIDDQTHDISGDYNWADEGKNFPGDNGLILTWGIDADLPKDALVGNFSYSLLPLKSELWDQRFNVGADKLFDPYGQFAGDDATAASMAPWGLYDSALEAGAPRGELLYDPATMIRRHFPDGWGPFKSQYSYNPYAIRVDVIDLEVLADNDPAPFQGGGEPYIELYMRDGAGNDVKVLGNGGGSQANWQMNDVEDGTLLALKEDGLLVHYWFYGVRAPAPDTHSFGIEVRESDIGFDDWYMDPEERQYFTFEGSQTLDFVKSKVTVKVSSPE